MSTTERLRTALADRYRIERELGAGGMATVYLAQDLKHDRKVAIKVLKPELAAVLGAERFVVEIKTTASLQHPHILPLFDSGTADGFLFYVMPFIEGETIRTKLNRETQFGVDEAIRIAREVADALDYAHRHGVIHRDIKPENILLHDGRAMVMDFGIALAVSAAAGGRMTETGLSLGTPHYMSPEQATADKDITPRSDVYSLASVLYEMLAGEPPHTGGSAQQVIMKIITEQAAPVSAMRKNVAPNVAAALAKALEKLPADRFENAKAFSDALASPAFALSTQTGIAAASQSMRATPARALIATAALAVIAALWGWLRPPPDQPVVRYQFSIPRGDGILFPIITPLPDGSALIYVAPAPGDIPGAQLWIKRRDSFESSPLPGTGGAESFGISPDGEWVAFAAGTQLRKVRIAGGPPVTLVAEGVAAPFGVAWLENGKIVFTRLGVAVVSLASVPENGGEVVTVWAHPQLTGAVPTPLPGNNGILFARCTGPAICETWAVGFDGDTARQVMSAAAFGQYSPTGHLVYAQGGRLLAVEFDPVRKEIRGTPVPLFDSVANLQPVQLSRSGTLVTFLGGSARLGVYQMMWVDRGGRVTHVDSTWRFQVTQNTSNHGWSLSPNGKQLAIGLATDAGDDIWIKELPRGPLSRLSFDPSPEFRPHWTPDGRSVTFLAMRPANNGVFKRRADGSGSDTLVVRGALNEARYSSKGDWLVFRQGAVSASSGGRDITGMMIGRDTAPVNILASKYDETSAALSPDGRWLAYQSDETGRPEIFIRSFPNVDGFKRQISNAGGFAPLWARDGRELFFLSASNYMMGARVAPGATLSIAEPVSLFAVPAEFRAVESAFYTPWDVAADGRFIMARAAPDGAGASLIAIVAENWFTELNAKVKR
ncbi:MAG TPA: protein kinase [Gemmatimonadaceae bacterium]|nr:protein kinase [Gemmatimonadaceae bacterium]